MKLSRIEQILPILIEALRGAEMRQGCTNHSYYAEILAQQILDLLEKPQTDSLRQPSPFREVPTIYTGGSAPPMKTLPADFHNRKFR